MRIKALKIKKDQSPPRLADDLSQSILGLSVQESSPSTQTQPTRKPARKSNLAPLMGEGDRIDWNSPRSVVDLTRKIRGEIGLDPCSNPRSIVGARVSWSIETGHNGLSQSWAGYGLVYCNPPYGDAIVPWINKAAQEAGRATQSASLGSFATEIVSLLPARTDTAWFSTLFRSARALAFWRGRLTFLGAPDPAPFPSMLPYYGPNPYRFADLFSEYAEIVIL